MSPTFPKLLVDFGRQFFWSPLTVSAKRDSSHKSGLKSQQINSTFYCDGDGCNGGDSYAGSVVCLSAHTANQQSSENLIELNEKNCLSTYNSTHYYTNCDQSIDTTETDETDIKFIISPNLKRIGKSLSEPNLLINCSYGDLVSAQTVITDNSESDVQNRDYDSLTSVTPNSTTSTASDRRSNTLLDEIESIRSTNPYNRLVEEIDWFNTTNTCAVTDSHNVEQNTSVTEEEEEEFVSQINSSINITTELCDNYLNDETNDDKSLSTDAQEVESIASLPDLCEPIVWKMNKNYINIKEIIGKEEDLEKDVNKMQQNFKQIQTMSDYGSEENVVLNDYFDNSSLNSCEGTACASAGAPGVADSLPKRHSLSSAVVTAAENERKTAICSRNSRRLIVTDKRLRNAVLDRLKRFSGVNRSQSHGRSDTTLTTNLSSRQFVLRTKGLYRNVKRRFSSVPPSPSAVSEEPTHQTISIEDSNMTTYSKINVNTMDDRVGDNSATTIDTTGPQPPVVLRHCSSFESIEADSGCGSSIQTSSLSTDSNRSSICTGDDMNSFSSSLLRGPFIGYAKAITDCTPCPYYKDALAFKRGDVISIISKDESGTWIGMTNGRIGHFKFVNVEEIKHCDTKRKTNLKLNQLIAVTLEKESCSAEEELNDDYNYNSFDKRLDAKIFDKLKSRLIESNGSLSIREVRLIIGLSDLYYNLLSIYGYNDLKMLSQIENKDTLNDCGITDACAQRRVLNTARLLRDYFRNSCFTTNEPLIRPKNTLNTSQHKYMPKRRDLRCVSAPTTPAMTPNIDFSSENFSQLLSKLESVSTTSLENSCSLDEITQQLSDLNTITTKPINDKHNTSAKNVQNSDKSDERIYENNEQIISATHEQQKSSTLDFSQQKPKPSVDRIVDSTGSVRYLKSRHNSVRFAIRDKSLDRNLLRKLDLKPIYMNDRNSTGSELFRTSGMTSSQSVMDLRTNNMNSSTNESTNTNTNSPIDTMRSKIRLKKLISSSRKFSSFSSHNSLMSLANSTTPTEDSTITKLVSNTLIEAIDIKLKSENIDLTEQPYSDSAGFCGIPPALIQRYGEEVQRDIYEIAEALDSLRIRALVAKGRRGIPNDYLGDACIGPVIDLANYESLHLWLISLGLPMYENCLKANGFENLYRISKLREVDIVNKCGIRDRRHVRALTNAIGALHLSLGDIDTKT